MMFSGLSAALVAGLSVASATDTSTETIVVFGTKPSPVGMFEDPTVAAESISLTDRIAVSETLGDVLAEATSVRVLRAGGEGAFEGLTIRGSEPDHTVLLVGDIPITGTDRGPVDLSLLPVTVFDRVEVYRGAGPAWLDQGQIGGIVRLIPRTSGAGQARAGVRWGSFGGYAGHADVSVPGARRGWMVAVEGRTRENDYAFFDDGATLSDPNDDRITRRRNARATQGHGFLQGHWQTERHRVDALALGVHADREEPGPGHRQAVSSSRQRTQLFGTLAHTYSHETLRLQSTLTVGWDRDALDDRDGEIGLGPEDTNDRFFGVGGRVAGRMTVTSWLDATVVGTARYDRYEPENEFATPGDQPSERTTGALTAEVRLHQQWGSSRLEVRPSVAVRATEGRLVRNNIDGRDVRSVNDVWPNFRLAAFYGLRAGLSLQASVASGSRLPTVLELFGDRSTLVANPFLSRERAVTWDVGARAQLTPMWGEQRVELFFETRGFGSSVTDLIRYRRTAQFTAVPENVASGQLFGAEGSVNLKLPPWLWFNAQAAWLRARDEERDRSLPLRAGWTGFGTIETRSGPLWPDALDELRARLTALYVGRSWFDPANLQGVDDRFVWGMALSTFHAHGRIQFTAQVRDLFDAGGSDLLGFPLAGRRFDVSLTWTEIFD